MTRTRTVAVSAAAAVLALTLSACSDDAESPDQPTTSGEPTSSQSSTAEPKDRSKQVFDAYTPREDVLASTSGKVDIGAASLPPKEVTFEVTGLRATADATILRYQLTADESTMFGVTGEHWSQQPSLRVPGTNVRTQTLTASLPEYKDKRSDVCVCTALYNALTTPQPQEVVYPALPEDVTEIDVIFDDLDPVTVPVTR